jgi:regulation of enolase protein 1 (concanavalin A-like superfamily)
MSGAVRGLDDGRWLNPPSSWSIEDGRLTATTDEKTDFWQKTFYGFVRDDGHFLGIAAPEAFTASVHVSGRFEQLYDQAGLMLRADAGAWIKTGVEFTDGALHLSAVVTRGSSDWSVTLPPEPITDFWLRLTAKDGAVRIQYSQDGKAWPLLRLAAFPTDRPLRVGPMLCSPKRLGLEVAFDHFHLGPAIETDLHDLS